MRLFGRQRDRQTVSQPKRRVVFVSHEATRTGAPLIALNLLQYFYRNCDIALDTILLSGGNLATDFTEFSTVDCFNLRSEPSDELGQRVRSLVQRARGNLPVVAVCNSMESRFVGHELTRAGIPTVSLIHELPSSYTESDYSTVFESNKVVFPCHAVRDQTNAKFGLPSGKTLVIPQGLLNPDFGAGVDRKLARQQFRRELGIPEDAVVVLGCGTIDLRKGCDHFAAVARKVSESRCDVPVHFVWIGGGPRWTHSLHHYIQIDLEKSAARDRVHFIGERSDVAPYFVGADIFLLTSRVDPFPCVVHEAMAAGLPIIAFENSGGASEAISNGAGFLVPFAGYDEMARMIRVIANQPAIGQIASSRAQERVHARYSFEEYGDKILELCETLAGQSFRNERITLPFRRAA